MAFLAGCMDIVFYKRFQCYVNMMTGNTIRFASALANAQWMDAAFGFSLLLSYSVGAGICRLVDLKLRQRRQRQEGNQQLVAKNTSSPESQLCVAVAPLVLVLFALADLVALTVHNRIYAPILSIGFGIVNAASSAATGGTILYAMTGHFMKLASSAVEKWWFLDDDDEGKTVKVACCQFHWRILASFIAGLLLSYKASNILIPILKQSSLRLPLQTMVGFLYALLLVWYGMPPHMGRRQ